MYSLVMLTALSTAPATPQFDGYFRDMLRGSCNGRDARSGGSCQGSCQGSCHGGGLFQGRIRNFFSDLFDGGSCNGSCNGCHGSCNGRGRDPLPSSRPYDRGIDPAYARGGCTGCYGGCVGSVPQYMGSCFGSAPNYSCFGSSCVGGLPPMNVPSVPYDYAPPSAVGFGADCKCGPGGVTGGPFTMPGLPQLGETYPTIPSPGLPMPPRTMPDGFDNPARPAPADRSFKVPADDDTSRGRVRVRLPADAKLFVEGRPLSVTDGERTFVTPPLPADREAVYTFKVEYTRDGDTVSHSRKVKVKAGATTVVDFADLTTAKGDVVQADPPKSLPPVPTLPAVPTDGVKPPVTPPTDSRTTSKPATEVPTLAPPPGLDVAKITVKLPQGATLFVNGGKNERTELVREFTTPTLTPNKTYRYTMRAELVRNGLPEYQESKVEFRAGDTLTVDFTSLADPPATRSAAK